MIGHFVSLSYNEPKPLFLFFIGCIDCWNSQRLISISDRRNSIISHRHFGSHRGGDSFDKTDPPGFALGNVLGFLDGARQAFGRTRLAGLCRAFRELGCAVCALLLLQEPEIEKGGSPFTATPGVRKQKSTLFLRDLLPEPDAGKDKIYRERKPRNRVKSSYAVHHAAPVPAVVHHINSITYEIINFQFCNFSRQLRDPAAAGQ